MNVPSTFRISLDESPPGRAVYGSVAYSDADGGDMQ
jgi:hypothetical protein